jgi:ATP phosphoribosyltransferase regulatory subunit HisZ
MIYEHEIPSESRLYFSSSAKYKRDAENIASKILLDRGYAEIVTPLLSYHQHQSIDESSLIRFSDKENNILSLRADSTLDVARIITKRLGRSVEQKKWFYIQPIFRYPSIEQYQIGCESLGENDLSTSINDSAEILSSLKLSPLLQISNINIPKIIAKKFDISLDLFKSANLEAILKLDIEWLSKLVYLQKVEQIASVIEDVPQDIKVELQKIEILCQKIDYLDMVIAPLYYSKMRYYDNLFFRYIENNATLGTGGNYNYEDMNSVGFALYTDKIVEELIKIN